MDKKERFLAWFHKARVNSIKDCPRDYVDIALQCDVVDMDLEEDAARWALHELIADWGRQVERYHLYNAIEKRNAALALVKQMERALLYDEPMPKCLERAYLDYQLRALVILSKPIETIADLPPLPPL